jgi:hypothetical protein
MHIHIKFTASSTEFKEYIVFRFCERACSGNDTHTIKKRARSYKSERFQLVLQQT